MSSTPGLARQITMYHSSMKVSRESILQNGLDYRLSPWGTCHEMPGNYLFDNLNSALDYLGASGYGEMADPPWDIWQVTIDRRQLTNNWENEEPGYISKEPIPPEKVRLLFSSDDCFACEECSWPKTDACRVIQARLAASEADSRAVKTP